MVINFVPLLRLPMCVFTSCFSPKVKIGLRLRRAGPLSLMLNTPPRVVLCYFKTPRRPRGERIGQPIKKYAYTRLLISRRPFKVCGSGGGAIYLLSAAADCQ